MKYLSMVCVALIGSPLIKVALSHERDTGHLLIEEY